MQSNELIREMLASITKLRWEYEAAVRKAVEIMHEKGYMCDPAERMIEAMEHITKASDVIAKAAAHLEKEG